MPYRVYKPQRDIENLWATWEGGSMQPFEYHGAGGFTAAIKSAENAGFLDTVKHDQIIAVLYFDKTDDTGLGGLALFRAQVPNAPVIFEKII